MHILFLTHYFPPEVNAPATRTFEHCRAWVRDGHRVTVITCAPNCPTGVVFPGYRNAWRAEETMDGIRVIRVWTLLAANKGFLGRTLNFVSFLVTAVWQALWLPNVDVVVATSPQFFCGWAGVLGRWLRRWPFVLEIRDIWPESIVTVGAMRRSLTIRVLERLERWMYAAADHIVTVGDGYRDQLLSKGVPDARISVIPNGVDLAAWNPRPPNAELRRRWNGEGKWVCAYVGTVGMAHGLDVVLAAAEKLISSPSSPGFGGGEGDGSDVVFWIIGDGAERERLEAEARRRGLENVFFTGMVPKATVAEALATCDATLVHLRGTELFGTVIPSKIFETMAMNVPIIMGVRGQARQIVLEAGGGVTMTPDDAGSLLAAIDELRADTDRYRVGRDYVAAHYDRDTLAARLLETLATTALPKGRIVPLPAGGSPSKYETDEAKKRAA